MPSYFRTGVNTYTLDKKIQNYLAALKRQITLPRSSPESVISIITDEVLMRAPSYIEEQFMICFGTEGTNINAGHIIRPKPNKHGKIPNWKTGRESFLREPGMYIRDAILEDSNNAKVFDEGGTFIGFQLGNLLFLNSVTRFSYINATKKNHYKYTTPYGMFAAFEYGTEALHWGHIKPQHGKWLAPTQDIKADYMVKTIPAYEMYSHINKQFIRDIIASEIRKVKFE